MPLWAGEAGGGGEEFLQLSVAQHTVRVLVVLPELEPQKVPTRVRDLDALVGVEMSQLRESALAQVRAELQRVVVPELPQHRPRGVHPAPRHEESVEVNKPLECHPAWRDALGYLGRNDLPHALELLGLVIFGTIGMSFRFQGEKVSPSARHRRKKRTRRRTLEGWGGPFCPCSSGSHLQGGAEARGLEVVELPVAQESVRILVADLEDPLQGTHAPRLELARLLAGRDRERERHVSIFF